jgi:hypothetical protein
MKYCSSTDNAIGVVEDLDELGKLARGFSSMDEPMCSDVEMQRSTNLQHTMSLVRAYECHTRATTIAPQLLTARPQPWS